MLISPPGKVSHIAPGHSCLLILTRPTHERSTAGSPDQQTGSSLEYWEVILIHVNVKKVVFPPRQCSGCSTLLGFA